MSKKSAAIAELIASYQGREWDPHYLGYFECFNRQLYFEAHDVLEELWLKDKTSPNYAFYKGLIQLAGAFVHLQKNRLKPAAALFNLAKANLQKYPAVHDSLAVDAVLSLIDLWLTGLNDGRFEVNPFQPETAPALHLMAKR